MFINLVQNNAGAVLALYDPVGVDVPLNCDTTTTTIGLFEGDLQEGILCQSCEQSPVHDGCLSAHPGNDGRKRQKLVGLFWARKGNLGM